MSQHPTAGGPGGFDPRLPVSLPQAHPHGPVPPGHPVPTPPPGVPAAYPGYSVPPGYGGFPQAAHPSYPPPPFVHLNRKEPALAALLSWLLPGLGQFYNGNSAGGVAFLVVYLVNLPFLFTLFWLVLPVLVAVGVVLWSIIDAVMGAQQSNRRLAAGPWPPFPG
ncbi:MAG: hypothetical protein ACFCUP_15890 [Actinomycetales bacterium]